MRALLVALTLFALGCGKSDPCDGLGGTCVTLTVSSTVVSRIDELDFSASGIISGERTSTRSAESLPIVVAIHSTTRVTGDLTVAVVGKLGGSVVGAGSGSVTVDGAHAIMSIDLEPGVAGDLGDDMTITADLSGPCTSNDNACLDGSTLSSCNANGVGFTTTNCVAGCAATPTPHCQVLTPSGSVASSDLTMTGVMPVTFPAGETRLNSDTGAITGMITRPANTINTNVETSTNGIAFHQKTVNSIPVGVFTFADVTVQNGATIKIIGTAAVALVSQKNFVMSGVIEARPMDGTGAICPSGNVVAGPGGNIGGAAGHGGPSSMSPLPGAGPGGGGAGVVSLMVTPSGGSGAGHAGIGGTASCGCYNGMAQLPGSGGVAFTNAPQGGSGGGGGGAAAGGGGGGSIQIDAAGVITIGDGTGLQGINAGGCGGQGANGGGGGGAGGRVFLEAPYVQIGAQAALAANGGGGGGQASSTNYDGSPGGLDNMPAYGGGSSKFVSVSGNGGAGDSVVGTSAPVCSSGCGPSPGLGGGGSAGRIVINAAGTPAINAQGILSPSVASGAAAFGTATVN